MLIFSNHIQLAKVYTEEKVARYYDREDSNWDEYHIISGKK